MRYGLIQTQSVQFSLPGCYPDITGLYHNNNSQYAFVRPLFFSQQICRINHAFVDFVFLLVQ